MGDVGEMVQWVVLVRWHNGMWMVKWVLVEWKDRGHERDQ